jgi:hypothetical protein
MDLAAFLFGNRIPQLIAFDLFQECCDPSPDLVDLFRRQYEAWGRRHDWRNMFDYYDMRHCQLVELSGSDYADQPVVVETQNTITTGFCDDLFTPVS